jgi:hypothetical protein
LPSTADVDGAALEALARERFGGSYCGGEVEKSMKRVINKAPRA